MSLDPSVVRNRIQAGVIVAVILIAIAIVVPAVQQAREAARRSQSKNNLRAIGMALNNYHAAFNRFPSGGTFYADGRGHHGWMTSVMNFVEAKPIDPIDFNHPWDASENAGYFRFSTSLFINPSIAEDTPPPLAFGLAHYSANSHLLAANSGVRLDDIEEPASTFIAGELGDDFVPWASPYNWRPLDGLNTVPHTYGRPEGIGGHFLMVDGSVRWIDPHLSPDMLNTLRGPDLAGSAAPGLKIRRPDSFPVTPDAWEFVRSRFSTGAYYSGKKNLHKDVFELSFFEFKGSAKPTDADLRSLKYFPHLKKLDAEGHFTDAAAAGLAHLTELEELDLSSTEISDAAFTFLRAMPSLKRLGLSRHRLTKEFLDQLQGLAHLEELYLSAEEIADGTVGLARSLPRLRRFALSLETWRINDEGLLQLGQLEGLTKLTLRGRRITPEGLAALEERLPQCTVEWQP